MSEPSGPVRSPCISICMLDEDDICTGCYRTAEEITTWMLLDDESRREVLARCIDRAKASNPFA